MGAQPLGEGEPLRGAETIGREFRMARPFDLTIAEPQVVDDVHPRQRQPGIDVLADPPAADRTDPSRRSARAAARPADPARRLELVHPSIVAPAADEANLGPQVKPSVSA